MPAMTPRAEPPWVLNEPVVATILPPEAAVQIAQRAAEPVEIEWPRVRVTQGQPPRRRPWSGSPPRRKVPGACPCPRCCATCWRSRSHPDVTRA